LASSHAMNFPLCQIFSVLVIAIQRSLGVVLQRFGPCFGGPRPRARPGLLTLEFGERLAKENYNCRFRAAQQFSTTSFLWIPVLSPGLLFSTGISLASIFVPRDQRQPASNR
jgi:hypothetical protein